MEHTPAITGTGAISQVFPQTFLLASSSYSNCESRVSALKTQSCESGYPDTCFTHLLVQMGVSLEAVIGFCACDTWWLEPDGSLVTIPTSRSGWTIHAARKFLTLYEIPSIIVFNDEGVTYLINVGLDSQEMFNDILFGQKAFFLNDGHWTIGGYLLYQCSPLLDVHLLEGGFGKKKKPIHELPNYGWEGQNPKDDRALYVEKQTEQRRKEYLKTLPRKPRKCSPPQQPEHEYYAAADPDVLNIASDITSLILIAKAYVNTKDPYVLAVGMIQMFSFVRENKDYMQLVMKNLPGLTEFSLTALLEWLKERSTVFMDQIPSSEELKNLLTPSFLREKQQAAQSVDPTSVVGHEFHGASLLETLNQFNVSDAGKLLGRFFSASVLTLMAKSIKSRLDVTVAQQLIMTMARECDFVDMIISISKKGLDFMARLFPLKFRARIRHLENQLEYVTLRKKVESSMDVSPIVVYQHEFYPYREGGLPALIADFERYRELSEILGKPLVRHFESKFSDFNFFNQGSDSRPLPFGIALVGPPGVGKTTMIEDIWTISREVWNRPKGQSVAIGCDAKFDDPYCGNDFVLLDDIGVSKPDRTPEDPFNRIIRIMQTTKNFSEQSEAHNKGKVPWNVKTLCVTSNLERLATYNYVNNPIAILRRFHIYLEVLPKDPQKYTFDFTNVAPNYFEEAFDFVFKKVKPEFKPEQPLSNPTENAMEVVAQFGLRSEALRYLTQRMREHVALQEREKREAGPLCLTCFKRPCECGAGAEEEKADADAEKEEADVVYGFFGEGAEEEEANVAAPEEEAEAEAEEEKADAGAEEEKANEDPVVVNVDAGEALPLEFFLAPLNERVGALYEEEEEGIPYYGATKVIKSKTNVVPFLGLLGFLTIFLYWRLLLALGCAVGRVLSWWNFFPLYVLCIGLASVLCFTDVFGCDENLQTSAFTIYVMQNFPVWKAYVVAKVQSWFAPREPVPPPPPVVEEIQIRERRFRPNMRLIRRRALRYMASMVMRGLTASVQVAYLRTRIYCLEKWYAIRHRRVIAIHESKISLLMATIAGITVVAAVAGYTMKKRRKTEKKAKKLQSVESISEKESPDGEVFSSCTQNTGVVAHGLQRSKKRTVFVQFNGHANLGYFIDSNRVLTVAHLFCSAKKDQKVKVFLQKNGEIAYEQEVPFSSVEVFKEKDFAIVTVPDHQTRFASMFQHSYAAVNPLNLGETYYYQSPLKGTGVVKFICTSSTMSYVNSLGERIQPPVIHVFQTTCMENKMSYGDCGTVILDSQGLNVGILVGASHTSSNFLVIPFPALAMQVVEQPVVMPRVQGTISESVVFDALTARPFGASVKIGEVRGVVVRTTKSDAKRSLLAGMQLDVNGEVPDPSIYGPPSIFRGGVGVRTGVYDTYHRNLGILKQAKAHVNLSVLSRALEDYWDEIRNALSDEDLSHIHPESYFNALSGKEDGKPTGIVRPAKLSTAVGYPFASGKKRDHITLTDTDVIFSKEFGEFLEKFENTLLAGETPFTFCKASPKDEVTKLSKTKTRLFYVGDSATYCVVRKYFWWFPMLVYKHPLVFECAFGVNPYSQEWADIQEYLNVFPFHQAADFSDWDLRLPKEFLEGAFTIMERLSNLGSRSPSPEFFEALKPLFTSPIALFGTELYNLEQGTVSGHPLTYLFNSMANSIRARYCFYTLFPTGKKFKDHVRAIYGGDDAHETTNLEGFNQLSTLPIMLELGIRPTDSNKNTISVPFSPKEEVTFLKRDEQGRLDIKSIHKMLMWTTSTHALEHASGAIVSALYEMHLYGRDAFNRFVESLRRELPRAEELNPANGVDLSYILQEKATFLDYEADCYKFRSTLKDRVPEVHFDKRSVELLEDLRAAGSG